MRTVLILSAMTRTVAAEFGRRDGGVNGSLKAMALMYALEA